MKLHTLHTPKILLAGMLAPLLPLTSSAATIWSENFDGLTTGSLVNDGDGTLDNFDTFFRIGGPTSISVNETSPGSYTDANHLYLGFRYQTGNANIVLSSNWDSGNDYSLSFDLDSGATQNSGTLPSVSLGFGDGTSTTATGILASTTYTITDDIVTLNVSGADIANAGANGQKIYLRLEKPGAVGNVSAQYYYDDFVLDATAAVPEPASTSLIGLAGLALLARRRR
ncbi:PEP-CTERM protein-sorting domain-containing protein [Rubritalea squalenifaciens DSM 18772]|uniref:PEP-CTERM protein-sorting domain-containing protein n=1 Tax=Rubritalea squalenifaciens DSM 18772 TaxID=1123071 RepID=A0A1M6C923_9BACT|nr:PEP-CTERM sorting domain-containing protein [Rubritalea squalenifaciens]SHI57301.1 PEP-CTERM protein-sorting domain-containing protein [Rubritalea squalenifaciens DSM 18772]